MNATNVMGHDAAQLTAIQVLTFLASDGDRLERFCSDTGLEPQTLRERAGTLPVMVAVLDYLLRDESLLLVFCTENGVEPDTISPAFNALSPPVRD